MQLQGNGQQQATRSVGMGRQNIPWQHWPRTETFVSIRGGGSSCSSGVVGYWTIRSNQSVCAWTNTVHGENNGHLLRADGAVLWTDNAGLLQAARFSSAENGEAHFGAAR